MKKHVRLILLGLLICFPALAAKPYLVLFKQTELAISSLEHGAFQAVLQVSNEKSVSQLKEWLGTRGERAANVQNLWLVRGVALSLEDDTAKKLAKEAWVLGVFADKPRRMLSPTTSLVVGNTLKELEGEAEVPWGLVRLGVMKLRAELPHINGSGVRVGIIDTGIQSNHPEFQGNLLTFKDFINGINNPYDDHGHGTHVAGTIAGIQVGVAPGAKLIVAKALSAAGSATDSQLLGAMQWIFDPDGNPETNDFPQMVSNSWGGDLDGEGTAIDIFDFAPYQHAIQAWVRGGIVPVFAAGNSGMSPNGFPAGLPEPIAVGAIGSDDKIADFSSRGPNLWKMGDWVVSLLKPDISAPGVKVTSSYPGNKYATWDGTSMATPHVAGSVALLLQANGKLKVAGVKDLLTKTCLKKGDTSFGYGVLDTYALVKAGIGW